ncbi:hypothetical protein GobsT_61160 [Gemmata obscuriglobus]|uniref:Uncharacterized protein n=1 Tax=Gemmata obscuriglobus TaxID=114 RepID=A0A2Z3GX86_9BACT|nr:hypothetical protein [Gemmata obscuriglobus]AWM36117.1 hypothetical protein C1280_03255 [Gemmata obscuriglobus]QEG31295.1 hypothetical protein GobsT_61160 [Gemmata obscuriglobus]VTS10634.1 unnamed protein product [Gemmata obscuriglobus UQM 2246]
MRRWPLVAGALVLGAVGAWALGRSGWFGATAAEPRPVPDGDLEIAWLHVPTSTDTWENFVWGMKRAEMSTLPTGLKVDDRQAFPTRTTAVPEIVLSRDGFAGKVHVRWYKITNDASYTTWAQALAARAPAPVAVIGGWSSDRARELAEALNGAPWPGQKPLLLLATATADAVYPDEDNYAVDYQPPKLIDLYDRSFRFCFTNKQMAGAITDFVFADPTLRPGPAVWPELRALAAAAGDTWAFPWLADRAAGPQRMQAFAVAWKDDPYSLDLAQQFREAIAERGAASRRVRLSVEASFVPFSTGRFARPNPYEARIVDDILAHPGFPKRGERSVLVLPTVTAPARRVLSALAQGNPGVARRLVAVTGDGIPVNALFRDGEFAWPVRALPIPLVLFTHTDPLDFDEPGGPAPPAGYELTPPPRPGVGKHTTEDIRLFSVLIRVFAAGAYPDGAGRIVDGADQLAERLRGFSPAFFDPSGNRISGSGEHIVVLRPTPRVEGVVAYPDAELEVWTRRRGKGWDRIRKRAVVQTVRPSDLGGGE